MLKAYDRGGRGRRIGSLHKLCRLNNYSTAAVTPPSEFSPILGPSPIKVWMRRMKEERRR